MCDINIDNVFPRKILQQEDTTRIAKQLLNQLLISHIGDQRIISRIVETEAYKAPEDKASHAYNNKYTEWTKVMFGKAGLAYIYLCYGIHNMLNIVCGPEGKAHAVLIRAVEPIRGMEHLWQRRAVKKEQELCNGPGKLCQALGIERKHNSIDLCDRSSELWIAHSDHLSESDIVSGPRVGVAYADECALWPWRFRLKNSVWTSQPDVVQYNKDK